MISSPCCLATWRLSLQRGPLTPAGRKPLDAVLHNIRKQAQAGWGLGCPLYLSQSLVTGASWPLEAPGLTV